MRWFLLNTPWALISLVPYNIKVALGSHTCPFRLLHKHLSHCSLEETLPHICVSLVSFGLDCMIAKYWLPVTVKIISGVTLSSNMTIWKSNGDNNRSCIFRNGQYHERKQARWKKELPINPHFIHTNTEQTVPFPGMVDILRVKIFQDVGSSKVTSWS